MTLRDFCKNKIENIIFRISLIVLIVSFLLSASIYFKKVKVAINEDVKRLEMVRLKINRTYEIKKHIERISAPELKNPELSMAQLMDAVNSKFPEIKLEISENKREGQEVAFSFSANADGNFQKFINLINFFQQQIYPVCFIHSISLKVKENALQLTHSASPLENALHFEIKGEFRVISNESQI